MAHKRGPKTEVPGEIMQKKVLLLDPMRIRKLIALANATTGGNQSLAVRRAIDLAYDRYQRS